MKNSIIPLFLLIASVALIAQDKIYVHHSDHVTLGAQIAGIDSLCFSTDATTIFLYMSDTTAAYATSAIDSLSFGDDNDTIFVNYDDSTAYVINPLAFEGISVSIDGADVTVNSTTETKDIHYCLTGNTTNGQFKLYSEKRFNLVLNGVSITNDSGPAINIQSGKEVTVTLANGTVNTLADGTTYATAVTGSDGEAEDQNATFFSEGQMIFNGGGSLSITGKGSDAHGLCSDDYIQVDSGSITIISAVKDGIHGNDGIYINNGVVKVTATSDGIDGDAGVFEMTGGAVTVTCATADVNCISCDSTMIISGGTLNANVNGMQSKGLKSDQAMTLSGGTITVVAKGAVALVSTGTTGRYDPSYCTAIKSGAAVTVCGANITITHSGAGGKGISSDTNVNITSGTVKVTTTGAGAKYTNASGTADAYCATCISANSAVNIIGGTVTLSSSGSGGKGITSDGTLTLGDTSNSPTLVITTSGTSITISGSGDNAVTSEAKTIKGDGAVIINNGTITLSSADDGIKSDVSVTFNGGTVNITKSVEGVEGPLLTVNNGTVSVTSSDDCFNATVGSTVTDKEKNDGSYLYFKGGTAYTNTTAGDGLDSNGNIVMSGGVVVVQGPSSEMEVGVDVNGTFNISGGILVATGPSAQNMEATSTSSSQYTALIKSTSGIGTNLFHIEETLSGTNLLTFKPTRSAYYVVYSSPSLTTGVTYSIYTGGSCTGTLTNGYYSGGTYTKGTFKKSFTMTSKVTTVTF